MAQKWTPPVVPKRQPGWEHAYAVTLERLAAQPFAWGQADCLTRVADLCEAMTGVNPLTSGSRRYRTAAGAARTLARLGFTDIEQALASVFPPVPKSKARRGDCGVGIVNIGGEQMLSTFIVMGAQAVGSNERGPVVVQTMQLKSTFSVG